MKDSALEQMRQILPELFETNVKAAKPGGMCTPESGCPPATEGDDGTDIIGMLFKSGMGKAMPGIADPKVRQDPSEATGSDEGEDRQM